MYPAAPVTNTVFLELIIRSAYGSINTLLIRSIAAYIEVQGPDSSGARKT